MVEKKYIRSIRAAIADGGMEEHKESLVHQYTNGRTVHISEMTTQEALQLIAKLNEGKIKPEDKRKKMIRLCYSIAYQCELVDDRGELDKKRFSALVERLSPWNKGLQEHDYEEMKILCSIMRKFHHEHTKEKEEA